MVVYLLQAMPQTAQIQSKKRKLSLHFASGEGHTDVVRALLRVHPKGASLTSGKGKLPLHFAARWGHMQTALELCRVHPESVHALDWDGSLALHDALRLVIATHRPAAAAIEQTFVNKDGAGTLKLGQARGVAMLAIAQAGLVPGEYAPNAVKKAVVGVGHADKKQIDHMVRLQLPGCVIAGPDAADALAIAICHAHHAQSAAALARVVAS